jgi:hypothetical protein
MLQAFWKISDVFVDFGSGRGIPVLFASFWAAFSAKEVSVPIVGIEKDPLRHSDSVMLLACGQYIAEQANFLHLRWPKVRLVLDDLNHESCWTNHQIKFGFLNNFCFALNKQICQNACNFVKRGMLACFKFQTIASESDDCITCVATFQNMGQWKRRIEQEKANKRARAEGQKRQREAVEKARQEANEADQNHDLRKLSDWRKMPAHIKDKTGIGFNPNQGYTVLFGLPYPQTDKGYFNWFLGKSRGQELTTQEMYAMHR